MGQSWTCVWVLKDLELHTPKPNAASSVDLMWAVCVTEGAQAFEQFNSCAGLEGIISGGQGEEPSAIPNASNF